MPPRIRLGIHIVAAALLFLVGVLAVPGRAFASAAVTGGGSGFAGLEIQQWQADVASSPYNLTVNYQSTSSSQGRSNFANGTWDYGASDIPYPGSEQGAVQQLQSGRCHGAKGSSCWNYVTVSAGGLGFMYNLQDNSGARIRNLKLTPNEVCKIFTGRIVSWSDPAIVATNPGVSLPSGNIQVISRADGAGESYVLSEFCIAVDPGDWTYFVNQSKNVVQPQTNETIQDSGDFYAGVPISYWPPYLSQGQNTIQLNGADGVADAVVSGTDGVNSITYVAAGYALVRSFPVASVQNVSGAFTQPNATSVNVALGYATSRGDGTFNLDFAGPDPRAYFPSTYSYVLAQSSGLDPSKGSTLGRFLCYAIGRGQQYAARLLYAPLSSAVVAISSAGIAQVPGAPSQSACTAGAPPPPPPPQVVPQGAGKGSGGGANGSAGTTAGSSAAAAGQSAGGSALAQGSNGSGAAGSGSGSSCQSATGAGQSPSTLVLAQANASTGQSGAAAGSGTPCPSASALGSITAGYRLGAQSRGPTNSQALWAVIEGAALCAVGLAFSARARRGRQ